MNSHYNTEGGGDVSDWNTCEHEWKALIDSQFHNENSTDVVCVKCRCPGEMDNKTKEVFWPAT